MRRFAGAVLCSIISFAVTAADLYVDCNAAAGGNGLKASPFRTIQEAITASSIDDVVHVAAGVYDQGTTNVWKYSHADYQNVWQRSRVYVDKRLTIIGAGKDVTTVMGSLGTYSSDRDTRVNPAYRVDGIQCMVIGDDATGTVIRGLKFEKGTAHQSAGPRNLAAGGVCRYTTRAEADFLVTDCEFEECFGRAGGGMCGGVAVRCTFTRGRSNYSGSAAYLSRLYNCLSRESNYVSTGAMRDFADCIAVNCTTLNNLNRGGFYHTSDTAFGGVYYNCASYGNVYTNLTYADPGSTPYNCIVDIPIGSAGADCTIVDNSSVDQMTKLNVCTATRDYRVVKGGLLDGKGKREYLEAVDFIPADELNVDFEGNAIAADAPIPVGIIMPTVEVQSGYVEFTNFYFMFNGFESMRSSGVFIQSASWPAEVAVRLDPNRHTPLVKLSGPYPIYPGLKDDMQLMLPPKGTVLSSAVTASRSIDDWYVDDDAEEGGAGTKEKPFKTIQEAVNVLGNKAAIIHVAAGTYGGVPGQVDSLGLGTGMRATVVVPAQKVVLIKAEEGPEKTFIKGCPDPATGGCGAGATICISASGSTDCAFAGFTICDGYSFCNDGTNLDSKSLGAAVAVGNNGSAQQFYDCVFTGNHGRCTVYGGWFVRCLFTNNTDSYSGILYNATLSSCILKDNVSSSYTLYNWVHAYNCSIFDRSMTKNIQNINGKCINCAYDSTGICLAYNKTDSAANPIVGSIIKAGTYRAGNVYEATFLREDPCFRDPTIMDFRLTTPSKAEGIGVATDPYGKIPQTDMLKYLRGDYYNRPLANADGKINAGAVSEVAGNGLFVDAVNGIDDEDHDGSCEAKAKKTLAAIMSVYRPANVNTVVALPGCYDAGSMIHSGMSFALDTAKRGSLHVRSRVVVPEGVTLISRDGPTQTEIVGAADPASTDPKGWGRGPDAIRCVFLEKNATVSGFTISGGRSDWQESSEIDGTLYQDDFFSGAVFGRDAQTGRGRLNGCKVVDCIITGNYSALGGAGAIVAFYDSVMTENYASDYGACARHAAAYNCYIDKSYGPRVFDCLYDCINVTFGTDIANVTGNWTYLADNVESGCRVWNVLNLMPNGGLVNFKDADVRNVVFPNDMKSSGTGTWTDVYTNDYTRAELIAMYADGKANSSTAPSVDTGYAAAAELFGTSDPAGMQRIFNGALDVGAFEYDWRTDYAAAIAKRREQVVVEDVSSSVVMTDGHPKMADGDEMTVRWPSNTQDPRGYEVNVVLNGTGILSVYLNGTLLGTMSGSGMLPFDVSQSLAGGNELRFAYAGDGDAYVSRLRRDSRGMTLILR